jgi:hypothetical protein
VYAGARKPDLRPLASFHACLNAAPVYSSPVFGSTKEALISSLLDEDAIKEFYKAMTKIMDFSSKLTKSFGGLKGILLLAASALTKMY